MSSQALRRLAAATVVALVAALGAATPANADSTTGAISGHITRPDGSPAADESVMASDVTFENPSGFAVTDESGFYSISDLVPGTYRVSIARGPLTQYAHGEVTEGNADAFTVTAGQTTIVDEQLLGLGTLRIAVTEPDGAPARGEVILHDPWQNWVTSARLDESGQVSLDVLASTYKVQVVPAMPDDPENLDYARAQWLHGKTSFGPADAIVVAPDTITEVSERLLITGSVAVTARDAGTGLPIATFCADGGGRSGCSGGTGSVVLTGLLPGPVQVSVTAEDPLYLPGDVTVVVVSGETVAAVVDVVRGGSITATVVDAATGQPVADACLAITAAGTGRLPDGAAGCSDAEGRVSVEPLAAGAYNLFVRPAAGSGYGAQWVARNGGTGDPAEARTVTVEPGQTTGVPQVKLDPAGTISGVVTSAATGEPAEVGFVSLSAWGRVGPGFGSDTDESGRYSLDWLGPYEWALLFTINDHARQWSGGVADRREAKQIKVHAGRTTTYSPALKVGTVLTGTMKDASGKLVTAEFDAFNAETGDPMGGGFSPGGTYRSLILGPQTIKIEWFFTDETGNFFTGWYDDDADFANAKPVVVPKSGTKTLDIVVTAG